MHGAAAPKIVITLTGLLDEDLNTGPISSRRLRPVLHAIPATIAASCKEARLGSRQPLGARDANLEPLQDSLTQDNKTVFVLVVL